MTVRRAVSLGALIAFLLGAATGLSHVGHSTISPCTGGWRVVVGHEVDAIDTATVNARVINLLPDTPCLGSEKAAGGGFNSTATFNSEQEAKAYMHELAGVAWETTWQQHAYIQAPAPTP